MRKISAIIIAASLALTGCATSTIPASAINEKSVYVPASSYKPTSYVVEASGSGPKRSPGARAAFVRDNPCPATGRRGGACPGYEVDHVRPLAAGGADHKSNMQWLSKSQHRAKTKAERRACVYGCGRKGKR